MIKALRSGLIRIRAIIVFCLVAMTVCSAVSSAHARALNLSHAVKGEAPTIDGGWSTPCAPAIEKCAVPNSLDSDAIHGLHHHHFGESQFSSVLPDITDPVEKFPPSKEFGPDRQAAVKSAGQSTADQPPKI